MGLAGSSRLKAGDVVELRAPDEILATLDEAGTLEGVPFMPEMLEYFGRQYTVAVQVERACDTITFTTTRKIPRTVMLEELRCSGTGHGGCQAQCRLYWKEAWLRRVADGGPAGAPSTAPLAELARHIQARTHAAGSTPEAPVFRCQATELLRCSEAVPWWSFPSFFYELRSGNVGLWRFIRVMSRIGFGELGRRAGILTSRRPFRARTLAKPRAQVPPATGLAVGTRVRVLPRRTIARTLDANCKTRGLWFDREMAHYSGQTARIATKVERFIEEDTGRLVHLKSDAYILEGVVCTSHHSEARWFCPREIYPWWRECWLEPVDPPRGSPPEDGS